MTDAEIFVNLCYYDPRNPESVNNITKCVPCGCPNCFKGTSVLAEELLKVKAFLVGQTTVHLAPRKKKIYLSGPITGMEEQAKQLFKYYQEKVESLGHEALNPFEFNHDHDKTWDSYMEVCLKELENADVVLMLPGWRQSKGANIERLKAFDKKIPVKQSVELLQALHYNRIF